MAVSRTVARCRRIWIGAAVVHVGGACAVRCRNACVRGCTQPKNLVVVHLPPRSTQPFREVGPVLAVLNWASDNGLPLLVCGATR